MEDNKNIPRFIKQTPWYKEGVKEEVKDHSYAKHGDGFLEGTYDEKRDKWEGYEIQYKNEITSQDNDESDPETDYELEIKELGLRKSDIKENNKQDKLEKMIRSRNDVPDYIKNINSVHNDNQWEKATK